MYGISTYTLCEKWPHLRGNVGNYTIHGSYGCNKTEEIKVTFFPMSFFKNQGLTQKNNV